MQKKERNAGYTRKEILCSHWAGTRELEFGHKGSTFAHRSTEYREDFVVTATSSSSAGTNIVLGNRQRQSNLSGGNKNHTGTLEGVKRNLASERAWGRHETDRRWGSTLDKNTIDGKEKTKFY